MPITVADLVKKAGLNPDELKKVKWGLPINSKKAGVYIIALSDNAYENIVMPKFPVSTIILKQWIDKVGGFKVDGVETTDYAYIQKRLSKFWLQDESILYIGKAKVRRKGSGLGKRINEYYNTCFGEKKPHAGGHWIKMLSILTELYVYYIECSDCDKIESLMLDIFEENISKSNKERLNDTGVMLPFANLENGRKIRKKHGISHMKI